jgi:hypothetical protein
MAASRHQPPFSIYNRPDDKGLCIFAWLGVKDRSLYLTVNECALPFPISCVAALFFLRGREPARFVGGLGDVFASREDFPQKTPFP